ncbi:Tango1 [Trypoxylus dichotomus]
MFKFQCVVIFLFILREIEPKISDKRLCANENCTKPISHAKTILKYLSGDHGVLSFDQNVDVVVYSKSAGSNMDLWGVEIKGVRGYAPKGYIRETRVLTKELQFLVDTEKVDQQVPSNESNSDDQTIKANKVPEFTVIDGTTIYTDPIEEISPTPRTNDVLPTDTAQNLNISDDVADTINEQDVNNKVTEPLESAKSSNEVSEEIKDDKPLETEKPAKSEKDGSFTGQIVQRIVDWIGDEKNNNEDVEVESEEDYEDSEEDDQDVEDEEEDDENVDELEEENDKLDDEGSNEEKIKEESVEMSAKVSEDNKESDKVPNEKEKLDVNVNDKVSETENVGEESVKLRQLLSDKESSESVVVDMQEDNIVEGVKAENDLLKSTEAEAKTEKEALNPEEPIESEKLQVESKVEATTETKTPEAREILPETVTESPIMESLEIEPPNLQDFQDYVTPNPLQDTTNIVTPEEKPEVTEEVTESAPSDTKPSDNNSETPVPKEKVAEVDISEMVQSSEESSAIQEDKGNEVDNQISEKSEEHLKEEDIKNPSDGNSNEIGKDKLAEIEEIGTIDNQILEKSEEHVKEEDFKNVSDENKTEAHPEDTSKDENIPLEEENAKDVEIAVETQEEVETPAEDAQNLDESKSIAEEIEKTAGVAQNVIDEEKSIESDTAKIPDEEEPGKLESVQDDKLTQPEIVQDNAQNDSGLLSGLNIWFTGPSNNENEVPKKEDEKTVSIDLNEGVGNENNGHKEFIGDVSNQGIEAIPVDAQNLEQIEKHDHDFVSIPGENESAPSKEETQSEELENQYGLPKEPVGDMLEEAPVTEEVLPVDLPEELLKGDHFGDMESHILEGHDLLSKNSVEYGSCPAGESDCPTDISVVQKQLEMEEIANATFYDFVNLLTLLGVTGFSVALFLLGFITIDKNRKEGNLIAKINTLEKALLVASKENSLLTEKVTEIQNENDAENNRISSEKYENLNTIHQETLLSKSALEEQIQTLEKELENSTEVGLELNRMLSDILSSQNGSDILIANVEQLQRQLIEQQGTINSVNDTLNLKDTENHELQLELEIKNKKVTHLQTELDKMAMNLFKVEEDKEQMQAKLEGEIIELKDQLEKAKNSFNSTRTKLLEEINGLKTKYAEIQRSSEVKTNEYNILKDNFNQIKSIKNNAEALQSLLNVSAMKAELQQLQRDNQTMSDLLRQEQQAKFTLEKQMEVALQEAQGYKAKYDESDKEKLEARTKLEVLSNYFKEKEAQLQKELSKHETMWIEKQGEATSTVERIKYMQEELQNYKSQNELLKQEIVSQEVELKSQISVLEKKAHESWVSARQAERRLEDAKQEAAQLRNRLTLKERSLIEEKSQNRMQSPLEQNGDVAISPLHMPVETPASPPLLYSGIDHLTTSPPLPNLPPFLPPPPGVPFMPPPIPGVPGFMPPPPSMFPVDHRPPPLGRMSSPPPPMNSRYSPDSRYSPYDRNSPSPLYDDDYGSSPPPMSRGYSPYNNRDDRRDFKRPPPLLRANGRNKGAMSSGSGNSNESLEKINRHHSKIRSIPIKSSQSAQHSHPFRKGKVPTPDVVSES